ncbi:MAG: glycosyltransferase family 4 protein [Pirellulales bacterium]
MTSQPLLLIISQVYVPDPASVGQHLTDVAEAMAARGYRVRVVTSQRGYEDPTQKYPARECRNGVEVVRLPWSSFGKKTLIHRLVGQALFLVQAIIRGLFASRLSTILVSTSPPMAAIAALAIATVRRVPIMYWVMDLNPDQAVTLRRVNPNGLPVRAMSWLNRGIFARAARVVVLDRFMAERITRQYHVKGKLAILPPWPHEDCSHEVELASNPFRAQHNPAGKFVVMYSGNHSMASPVTTLVEAAVRLRNDDRFLFIFIGGGLGKRDVDAAIANHRPPNILSLPYQPLDQLKYSLAAADLHTVTLGDDMVGIIHPCKIYGAMAVGRPVLFVGPAPSHAADVLTRFDCGWHVHHGDLDATVAAILTAASMCANDRHAMGRRGKSAVEHEFSKRRVLNAFCDLIEATIPNADSREEGPRRSHSEVPAVQETSGEPVLETANAQ